MGSSPKRFNVEPKSVDIDPASDPVTSETETVRKLAPAAKRALAEAEQRRLAAEQAAETRAREIGGRKGLDPARYGDWEVKGIASDF